MRRELYNQLQAELEAWHQSQTDQQDGLVGSRIRSPGEIAPMNSPPMK